MGRLAFGRSLLRPEITVTCALLALLTPLALPQKNSSPDFYEFGRVVAIGQRTLDIQTFDTTRQRLVQHSFAFSRETRADIVHVGDAVEVLFTTASGEWSLRRVIVLAGGIPVPAPTTASSSPSSSPLRPDVPAQSAAPPATAARVMPTRGLTAGDTKASKRRPHANAVELPPPPAAPAPAVQTQPNLLASAAAPRPTVVVPVELGSPAETKAREMAKRTHPIAIDRPAEECNRSSADWPGQPLRMAVLDFRYPTEREESHDVGTTGGGSGTAVADLVFARLEEDEQNDDSFLFSRADRRRLDRSDFAGAARLGRQLGVDAVLAGTFVPVGPTVDSYGDPVTPKTFELRAGIVDTCTGQLLLQSASVVCPGAVSPGLTGGADPSACTHLAIKASETANPKGYAQDFKAPLDAMLYPLEHQAPATHAANDLSGVVTRADGVHLTVQLPASAHVRPGDQLAVHASRLAKNLATYTLQLLADEIIGRLTVDTMTGDQATGTFTGDFKPRPGDRAAVVTP